MCVYKSSEASLLFRGQNSMSRMLVGNCLRLQPNVCKLLIVQAVTRHTRNSIFDDEKYFPISQTALLIITKCESFHRRPHVRNDVALKAEDLQNQAAQRRVGEEGDLPTEALCHFDV